ncbi:DUF2157 domain-containing protein [Sulfurospirillum diekertiae]|uniref:DUF2157 domain-containing protein n=2 Tax=Sulfurospirillum diekertiae TaxID=1854492 RepID=UPI000B4C8530|nr:DUF2157 domain-containing protein [Sulfurospirillum diekertiae]ASC94370.1 hypothetical protein Sdiek2_2364 [Sulfurospirillum diekertiae]
MSKETYQWLEKELPSWVQEGIVTDEGAQVLLRRYVGEKTSSRSSGIAFSLLGFALVGLGIISLLAYNWDALGHLERTLFAIVLLVGAQTFSFFVKRYKPNNTALLEGSGIFWFLMMGASLAIIGQTYHLGGTVFDFLSIWLLLSFGIAWLLPSSGAAFLQIFLWTVVWISHRSDLSTLLEMNTDSFLSTWALLGIVLCWLGYYVWQLRTAKNTNGTLLLSWELAISLFLVFLVEILTQTRLMPHLRSMVNYFALFFALYYMAGMLYLSHGEKTWQRPFERIGKFGALFLVLTQVSFRARIWLDGSDSMIDESSQIGWLAISLIVLFVALLVLFLQKLKQVPAEVLIILAPIIFLIYTLLQSHHEISALAPMLFINVSLLLGASWMIVCGAKEGRLGLINQGMILIALTVWIHFMDAKFDLVAKGVAFIVTGILFLVINAFVRRKLRANA